MIIYPYKRGLKSTAILRDKGCKIRYGTSRVRRGVATSWGCSISPHWQHEVEWINDPSSVPWVSNKDIWATLCEEHGFGPVFTESMEEAQSWAEERGEKVLCRTILNGSRGRGIVVARNPDQVVPAPLYSLYFRKQREYRIIYSIPTGIVYAASKRLSTNTDLHRDSLLIRTAGNGFVYQLEHDYIPEAVRSEVRRAGDVLDSIGLKLLAYDVAYNTDDNTACVIEANSAWGVNEHSAELSISAMKQIGETLC